MTGQTACPISEVDRALSSYIHTREDSIRIRRALSRYLTTNLRPVTAATQNQHLNHENPRGLSATNANPPGLKDSRLAYLHALRAQFQAQAKYRELQGSLEELQNRDIIAGSGQSDSDYDNEVTQSYVSLLRERRRFAELQVIQESIEKLLNARPSYAPKDPKAIVKDAIGEQPDLPAERIDQLSQPKDNQTGIFKLKQEVLDAKASMDRANTSRSEAQNRSRGIASLQKQIYALEQARDEIVDWVQAELAKMEEESEFLEDASPIKRSATGPSTIADFDSSEAQIREAYDQYTRSRSNLIEAHGFLQQPANLTPNIMGDQSDESQSTKKSAATSSATLMSKMFTHLPPLALAAGNERSLLQQAVYLQSQIAGADEEVEESLLRLSGESHLLHGGSKDVTVWAKTAAESEAATKGFVKERLQESGQEISGITTIVELCSLQSKVLSSS